jgi:hypothetical protein
MSTPSCLQGHVPLMAALRLGAPTAEAELQPLMFAIGPNYSLEEASVVVQDLCPKREQGCWEAG